MIIYRREYRHILRRALQCKGSVFPSALCVALSCSFITAALKFLIDEGYVPILAHDEHMSVLKDNSCWSGFVFLVGFLTVFRTSQAYIRFGDGCTAINLMRAEWYDACSSLVAFCKVNPIDSNGSLTLQHILIRLFSMLHAVALADIEDTSHRNIDEAFDSLRAAFHYDLVDPGGLDMDSLRAVKDCHAKVELIYNWIQQLIVENVDAGVLRVPAPILSRSFQELSSGMVAFREAVKVSSIPFPFPYAQICEVLLMLHWLCTPIVISQYVSAPWWGGVFSFLQVFVYWSMNGIAIEIEHPFGTDANDLDTSTMQEEMNGLLRLLVEPYTKRTPVLSIPTMMRTPSCASRHASLLDMWKCLEEEDHLPARRLSFQACSSLASSRPARKQKVAFQTARCQTPGRMESTSSCTLALRLPTPAATPNQTPNESVQSMPSVQEENEDDDGAQHRDSDDGYRQRGSYGRRSFQRTESPVNWSSSATDDPSSPHSPHQGLTKKKANLEVIMSAAHSEVSEKQGKVAETDLYSQSEKPETPEVEEAEEVGFHIEEEPSMRRVHGPKVAQADILEEMVLFSSTPSMGMSVYPHGPPKSFPCSPGSQLSWNRHGLRQVDMPSGPDLGASHEDRQVTFPARRGAALGGKEPSPRSNRRRHGAPPPPSSKRCFAVQQLRPLPERMHSQPTEEVETSSMPETEESWYPAHGFAECVQIDAASQYLKQQI